MVHGPDASVDVEKLRAGDADAWEELYRAMYPAMAGYARRRLPSEDARDAVAEAMARAIARCDRIAHGGATAEAWIFGILRHVVVDLQRRSYRTRRLPDKIPRLDTTWANQDDMLIVDEDRRQVRQAFARLSARDQHILELRVIAGFSSEQVAQALGMGAGATRNAQYRALRRLRELLEPPVGQEAPR